MQLTPATTVTQRKRTRKPLPRLESSSEDECDDSLCEGESSGSDPDGGEDMGEGSDSGSNRSSFTDFDCDSGDEDSADEEWDD